MNSLGQHDILSTSNKRKAQKIQLFFQDHIKKLPRFSISMFPWIRIDQLKKQLTKNKYNNDIHWKDLRFFYKNIQLQNNSKRLFDHNIQPQGTIIIMNRNLSKIQYKQKGIINPYEIFTVIPDQISNLLLNVTSGLIQGNIPKLTPQGTSGTYFLENHQKKRVAIFKPFDQQPYAPNNPRNYVGQLGDCGIRKGILSGQCATRQVATYLLDHDKFHGVPATTYIQFYHPVFNFHQLIKDEPIVSTKQNNLKIIKTKHGSLQQFVESNDIAGNLGCKQFDTQQVHKIAILDLRILNCDRNEANILVKKMALVKKLKDKQKQKHIQSKFFKLTPIDHGLSFPDNFQIYSYQSVWMDYPQSSYPLSDKSLKFIQNINPVIDCINLREKLGFREICLRNFRIAETFLKKAASAGFTLKQIGQMIYRNTNDDDEDESSIQQQNQQKQQDKQKSQLQKIVEQAESIYSMVKKNGIQHTIQFQIGLIKPRKQDLPIIQQDQVKSPMKNIQTSGNFKQLQLQKKKSQYQKHKHGLRRKTVSLPHLISSKLQENTQKIKLKKRRKRQGPNGINKVGRKNQVWEEIFFHYFEDLVDRLLAEKIKQRRPARSRILSQSLDDI